MRIQIVEDDSVLSDGIRMALSEPEVEFIQCTNIRQARSAFAEEQPDLLILDINLPDGSGYDYLRWLRERSELPVLILTANDMEIDEVMGLSLGADDYMTKPFHIAVLRARMQVLARRIGKMERMNRREGFLEDGFSFQFEKMEYQKNGKELSLSVNEQKLLRILIENQGHVLTRSLLFERLWNDGNEFVDANALSVTINRLRSKLESKRDGVSYIQTVYGQGYMWKKKVEADV